MVSPVARLIGTKNSHGPSAGVMTARIATSPGAPNGPIGLPGEDAIKAAISPVDGPWLFFVPINLQTGETVFSETASQHQAAAEQLYSSCRASDENASYCE